MTQELSVLVNEGGGKFWASRLVLEKKFKIPPNSVVQTGALMKPKRTGEMVIVPGSDNKGVILPNMLVKADDIIHVQIVNDGDTFVHLHRGHVLGYAVECDIVLQDEGVSSVTACILGRCILPNHLEDLYSRSVKILGEPEVEKVKLLLTNFQDIFSKGSHDLGCFSEIKHTINTSEEKPVKQLMRRTPIGFEKEEEENLKQMLETGVIKESCSEWASALVLVWKKDGTVRYCVNFRLLNAKTVKDLFPLPSISQCLDQLSGNTYFSTLDMASGYCQIEIDEKDRHKFGLFEHKRMAFGLCNAPATFQRAIQFVLRGLT